MIFFKQCIIIILQAKLYLEDKDQTPLCLETDSLKVIGAKVTSLSSQKFVNSYTSGILPGNLDEELVRMNEGFNGDEECHGLEMISFLQNPFSWGQGGERVSKNVGFLY